MAIRPGAPQRATCVLAQAQRTQHGPIAQHERESRAAAVQVAGGAGAAQVEPDAQRVGVGLRGREGARGQLHLAGSGWPAEFGEPPARQPASQRRVQGREGGGPWDARYVRGRGFADGGGAALALQPGDDGIEPSSAG